MDDLTVLEIVNLLTVGITLYNIKQHIPTDIPVHNQFIPPEKLKSQKWLNEVNDWTKKQKMLINENKTKSMIFNFTKKYQFATRLKLNDQNIETLNKTKLLGTIVTDDLRWEENTKNIVKKANARMELLRRVSTFSPSDEDMKHIYILFVRSLLEQSASVWHSSLTEQDSEALERVQKSAVKIILGNRYIGYQKSLQKLDLEMLHERREKICLKFAQKCLKNPKTKDWFPLNVKSHQMTTRKTERYKVQNAKTERYRKSPITYMQHLLNEYED